MKKQKRDPFPCPTCSHNMGRSKCKPQGVDQDGNLTWIVRCNSCKTVYDVVARFPKTEDGAQVETEQQFYHAVAAKLNQAMGQFAGKRKTKKIKPQMIEKAQQVLNEADFPGEIK